MQSFILLIFTALFSAFFVQAAPLPQLGGLTSALPVGDITSLLSDPTAATGELTSLPETAIGTVEGLVGGSGSGGLGAGLLRRQANGLLGLDPAALPADILNTVGLGDIATTVEGVETNVEGVAGGGL